MAVGKWHLGFHKKGSHPLDAGFDEYVGYPHNYLDTVGKADRTIYRGRKKEQENVEFEAVTPFYNNEVTKFIEREKDGPFFIYMAHQIAHVPLLPSEAFLGSTKKGRLADFMAELDDSVGQVLKALRKADLDRRTLVVFLGDNGRAGGRPVVQLSGMKFNTMEGGHRVPCIFRWTGEISAGKVSNTTISSMDFLPLFCELAGVDAPMDRTIDGKNILNVLLGKSKKSPHPFLYYYNGHNLQAIRMGKWKLHLPRTKKDQPYWGAGGRGSYFFFELDEPFLVDLEADLLEKENVASEHPEVLAALLKEAERIRVELGDVGRVGTDQRPGWPSVEIATQAVPRTRTQPRQPVPAPRIGKTGAMKNAAPIIAATPSKRSASFDFESGKLAPWKVLEGEFGLPVGNRATFLHQKEAYNKQGTHYLTTLETGTPKRPSLDTQKGVIVSPLFVPQGGVMTFRVGGGKGVDTYVALCTEAGKEVRQARGVNSQLMQKARWGLEPYVGKKMFIKIVDQASGGWAHITADNFQFDAEILTEYPAGQIENE